MLSTVDATEVTDVNQLRPGNGRHVLVIRRRRYILGGSLLLIAVGKCNHFIENALVLVVSCYIAVVGSFAHGNDSIICKTPGIAKSTSIGCHSLITSRQALGTFLTGLHTAVKIVRQNGILALQLLGWTNFQLSRLLNPASSGGPKKILFLSSVK